MHDGQYIMREQAHDTVRRIMNGPRPDRLLLRPAWLGLLLLVAAINLLTLVPYR